MSKVTWGICTKMGLPVPGSSWGPGGPHPPWYLGCHPFPRGPLSLGGPPSSGGPPLSGGPLFPSGGPPFPSGGLPLPGGLPFQFGYPLLEYPLF